MPLHPKLDQNATWLLNPVKVRLYTNLGVSQWSDKILVELLSWFVVGVVIFDLHGQAKL